MDEFGCRLSKAGLAGAWLLGIMTSIVAPVCADPAPSVSPELAQEKLEELKERLALTPEQEAQIKPLLEARRAKLEQIHAKYAGDTSRRAKRYE